MGPDGVYTTLSGSGTAIQAYFYQGYLTGTLNKSGSPTYRPFINTQFDGSGSCATYGQFGYSGQGYSTNKCASFPRLQIQSNSENSQLGAKLTYNYVGGFYSCGPDEMVRFFSFRFMELVVELVLIASLSFQIWYKQNSADGPSGCSPVDLYTVPVL
jgi:hypothetical protein